MRAIDRKRELFQNIVRLRRAARDVPDDRDIVAVRSAFERELGETVSLSREPIRVREPRRRGWISSAAGRL